MKKLLLVLAATAALGVGLMAVAVAGAQEGEEDGPVQNFVGRLAEKLGISEDELTTAVKDVELEMVDQALAEGRITEEQAAQMRERIENGELRFPGPRHHGDRCELGGRFVRMTAEILGIEPQAVIDGLQGGKSLAQIAEENGLGVDEYKAALTAAVEDNLAEKVEEGYITQEQADRMLANFNENVDRIINHEPEPGRPGPCRGHRQQGPRPDGDAAPEEGAGL